MKEVIGSLDKEVVEYMFRHCRQEMLQMIRDSWLPPKVMQDVFDTIRPESGSVIYVAKLSMSHPNPAVRAMAASELLAFVDVAKLGQYLWC